MQAFARAGFAVPDDISVMGYDGTEICGQVIPHLSSVHVPLYEIGARSMQLLMRQIKADKVSTVHRVLAVRVVARDSTAPPKTIQPLPAATE